MRPALEVAVGVPDDVGQAGIGPAVVGAGERGEQVEQRTLALDQALGQAA